VPMLGVTTKKCVIKQEGATSFRIVLIQGLNRQIRRMCEHYGYTVTKLERVRIMHITLKGLAPGDWRDLTEEEIRILYKMVEKSSPDPAKKAAKSNSGSNAQPSKKTGQAKKAPTTGKKSAGTPKFYKAESKRSDSGKRKNGGKFPGKSGSRRS
jgi:23S rRNA pseudouridine2604 synthase